MIAELSWLTIFIIIIIILQRPTKKGHYAVRPGVEGFFITCDGGRENQARNEAINLLDKVSALLCNTLMCI
jgi:hypothetical protein